MPLESLRSKRIFLTGGTGFFGKSILDQCRRGALADNTIMVLSRNPEAFRQAWPSLAGLPNVRLVAGDVRTFALPGARFDLIIHAATPIQDPPPEGQRDIILRGTEQVLRFAQQCGAEKILFTSSGEVYGPQPPGVDKIPETFPCRPVTEYGIAKYAAEQMLVASGIHTVIARCFAFTGPYLNRHLHFAIGNFIRDCLAGTDIIIRGDGTPYRSYLYADDLVDWLLALLDRGESSRPYNVGSEAALTILELAHQVRVALGTANDIQVLRVPDPAKAPSRYVPLTERIRRELGVAETVALPEAIRRSAENR